MTEEEWLTCTHPLRMWEWLVQIGRVNRRQCGHLFAACCERIRRGMVKAQTAQSWNQVSDDDGGEGALALLHAERHLRAAITEALIACSEEADLALLFRDIIGNPFRSVELDRLWRTPDVLFLAQAAEHELSPLESTLQPTRLPILADALEDAGCTSADLLDHLREPGPHVRGCWALDLVLRIR